MIQLNRVVENCSLAKVMATSRYYIFWFAGHFVLLKFCMNYYKNYSWH